MLQTSFKMLAKWALHNPCFYLFVCGVCCLCVVYVFGAHTWVGVCVRVHVSGCTFIWLPEEQPVALFTHSVTYFLGKGLSLNPNLSFAARLAGQWTLKVYLFSTQCWVTRHTQPYLEFYMGAVNSNSGSHAHRTSVLTFSSLLTIAFIKSPAIYLKVLK